jgi:hypothetical protein
MATTPELVRGIAGVDLQALAQRFVGSNPASATVDGTDGAPLPVPEAPVLAAAEPSKREPAGADSKA